MKALIFSKISFLFFILLFLIFISFFLILVLIWLYFWRKKSWDFNIWHCQPHILCNFLNLWSLISNYSYLEKLEVFPMHLKTFHISIQGIYLALDHFVESSFVIKLCSNWVIILRSIFEEQLQKLLIFAHYKTKNMNLRNWPN